MLLASSDDFLLSEALEAELRRASADLEGASVEVLPEEVTPSDLALEVLSPSLFSPRRILVAPDVGPWFGSPTPGSEVPGDVSVLVETLGEGLPVDVALLMGACCPSKPKGKLVDAVASHGEVRWLPLPPRPKPWEDAAISREEEEVLLGVLGRAVGSERWEPAARRLLLERLGFAPRRVAQEAAKLATAAGPSGVVDEALVRRLVFPRERSLEVVRDAVLQRQLGPILGLLSAHAEGLPVLDWQGRPLDPKKVILILFAQITSLLEQMLYLRRLAADSGVEGEMAPERTGRRYWYGDTFKKRLAAVVLERLEGDGDSPFAERRSSRSPWNLGQLFAGAGRWEEPRLVAALAAAGATEAATRSPLDAEALTAWLAAAFSTAEPVQPVTGRRPSPAARGS